MNPRRKPPSRRRERLPDLPAGIAPRLRDIYEWPAMRRAFIAADAVWAVDKGRRVLFYGRRAVERADKADTVPGITMLVPMDLDNSDNIDALERACLFYKGSCCRSAPDSVHPLAN